MEPQEDEPPPEAWGRPVAAGSGRMELGKTRRGHWESPVAEWGSGLGEERGKRRGRAGAVDKGATRWDGTVVKWYGAVVHERKRWESRRGR